MTKEKSKKSILPTLLTLGGMLVIVLFSPLISWTLNAGNIVGMILGFVFTLIVILRKPLLRLILFLKKRIWGNLLLGAVGLVLAFLIATSLIFIGNIIGRSFGTPPEDATVIILGCMVRRDGEPGTMLIHRLNAAYDYLTDHPDSVCILSGGQGEDEGVSEAQAMFTYLTGKGISPDRLILEDKSTSTLENLTNSAQIIAEKGLSTNVAVVTSFFHEYRAYLYSKTVGLTASPISAYCPLGAIPVYVVRELCGLYMYNVRAM